MSKFVLQVCGILIVCVEANIASGQIIERILNAPLTERPSLVALEMRANAKKLDDKVLDLSWSYSGKFPDGNNGDQSLPPRPRGDFHIISGRDLFWSQGDFDFVTPECDKEVVIYQNLESRYFKSLKGNIVNVTIVCGPPVQSHYLGILDKITPCLPWQLAGRYPQTPQVFEDMLRSCEWHDDVESKSKREVFLRKLTIRAKDSRASIELIHRFSENDGELQYRGSTSRSVSVEKFDGEEWLSNASTVFEYDYREYQGVQLPARIHSVQMSHTTNLDGTPFKQYQPYENFNVTWTLKKCTILDEFPMKVFDIKVPPTAKIVNLCRDRAERQIQQEAKQTGWARWRWLLGGCALCLFGIAILWYRRIRK